MRSLAHLRVLHRSVARSVTLVPALVIALLWRGGDAPRLVTEAPSAPRSPDHFELSAGAREQLSALWRESAEVKQERVGCLAVSVAGAAWQLSEIMPLAPSAADSLRVSASSSVSHCGPPHWVGTVHTHVAPQDGVSQYQTFSGSDRGVMMMWWRQWGQPGIFCVVYSAHDVHCEADGLLIAGPGTHVTY